MTTFKNSMNVGNIGETTLTNYWTRTGWQVSDLRYEKEWQKKDVDYRIQRGDKEYLVDVKSDTYSENNFAIETLSNTGSNTHSQTQGNIIITEADVWYYYFISTRICYKFSPVEMLSFVNRYRSQMRTVYPCTRLPSGNKYHSECVLVPIRMAIENGIVKGKKNLSEYHPH